MRISSFFCLALFAVPIVTPTPTAAEAANSKYDSELAAKVGADEYGMRSYVFVVLKTGPADITDPDRRREIFAGHFANMGQLAEAGKLVLAGPFIEGGEQRGMYIFNVSSIEDAQALVQTDPAVAAGIFVAEFTRFYGSAGLMLLNDIHKTLQKTRIG
jgi:uncharacterized protein